MALPRWYEILLYGPTDVDLIFPKHYIKLSRAIKKFRIGKLLISRNTYRELPKIRHSGISVVEVRYLHLL